MRRILISFLVLTMAAQACNFLTGIAGNGTAQAPETVNLHPSRFTAQATSGVSIMLAWPAAEDAQKYLLDVRTGEEDFLPLVELSADQTSHEDVGVPEEMQLSYRLRVQTASGTSEGEVVTVTTPKATPDPLTVQANEYKPVQWTRPTPDPKNPIPDPSKMFPPGFDPSNPESFDPSAFLQPVRADVVIGPEGGVVTVTTPDKITYTLTIPAGALDDPTPISLVPIETIDGLPFSGGLLGAVRIEPDGLPLNLPASLTITREETAPLPDGMFNLAFAFEGMGGGEFHLYPFALVESVSAAPGGLHPISLVTKPHLAGTLGGFSIADLKAYGAANGTKQEAAQVVKKHGPNAAEDRLLNQLAYGQDEEPEAWPGPQAPLAAEKLLSLSQSEAFNWSQMTTALSQLEILLKYYGNDKSLQPRYEKIWDLLLDRLGAILKGSLNKCLNNDDTYAQAVVAKMTGAKKGSFGDQLATRFTKKFGDSLLKDAAAMSKACVLNLQINSEIKADVPNVAAYIIRVHGTIDHLKFNYGNGKVFLSGQGTISYGPVDIIPHGTGKYTCEPFVMEKTITAQVNVTRLEPVFADVPNGQLQDLRLGKMTVKDDATLKGQVTCTNIDANGKAQKSTQRVNIPVFGGSVWYGYFTQAHMAEMKQNTGLTGWTVPPADSRPVDGSNHPIIATKDYITSGNWQETSKFTLIDATPK